MARPGGVWWRKDKKAWYSTIGGKMVRVAGGDKTHKQAEDIWHQMQAKVAAADVKAENPVWVIFDLYMDWILENHPGCYKRYKAILQGFLDNHGHKGELRVRDLEARHVSAWLKSQPQWKSSTTQWLAVTVLQAALNWAAAPERRIITSNPIEGLAKPQQRSRGKEAVIDPDDRAVMRESASPALGHVLLALEQTGTRPINLCRVTAADCKFDRNCIELGVHKTAAKTGRPLLIPMTAPLKRLLRELCEKYPEGAIFRDDKGRPWSRNAMSKACQRASAASSRLVSRPDLFSCAGRRGQLGA